MYDKYEAKKILYGEINATAKANYTELLQAWSALDQKAMNSIMISGIFLAAAFSFVKEILNHRNYLEQVIVVAVIMLLISAVALSLLALWTRKTELAHRSTVIRNHVERIIQMDGSCDGICNEFLEVSLIALNAFSEEWDASSASVLDNIKKKGRFVKVSQILLFVALLLVSVSIVCKVMLLS